MGKKAVTAIPAAMGSYGSLPNVLPAQRPFRGLRNFKVLGTLLHSLLCANSSAVFARCIPRSNRLLVCACRWALWCSSL